MANDDKQMINVECGQKLDPVHVTRRKGAAGRTFDYVTSYYVPKRMCEVFGATGWDSRILELTQVHSNQDGTEVSYMAQVAVHAAGCTKEDVGVGHGKDRSAGAAIESACKEAVTDAMKRACRLLGDSLGLALYDKTRANVASPKPAPKAYPAPKAVATTDATLEPDLLASNLIARAGKVASTVQFTEFARDFARAKRGVSPAHYKQIYNLYQELASQYAAKETST